MVVYLVPQFVHLSPQPVPVGKGSNFVLRLQMRIFFRVEANQLSDDSRIGSVASVGGAGIVANILGNRSVFGP